MAKMTAAEVLKMSVMHPKFVREQRNVKIRAMRDEGYTLRAIGKKFGLTFERINQICREAGTPTVEVDKARVFAAALNTCAGPQLLQDGSWCNHAFLPESTGNMRCTRCGTMVKTCNRTESVPERDL